MASTKSDKALTLELLPVIKEAQQQHGLRHGDFQRYRSYCSRRLRRIRKSLHFSQSSKQKFKKRKVTEANLSDIRYLYIPLATAERAWSYAMQLKQEANTEPRKRFHLIRRLRVAAKTTTEFEKLSESGRCDARTKLEVKAYHEWMHGLLNFELRNWNTAMEHFHKTVYEKLASALSDDDKVLYQQRVDEITPNMRFCAYNVGDESAIQDLTNMRHTIGEDLALKLDSLIVQAKNKQLTTLSEVKWCGRNVPVRQQKVRVFLLHNQDTEQEVQRAQGFEAKHAIYEKLLLECKDALQTLRDDLQADPLSRSKSVDGQVSSTQFLYHYLTYIRLSRTIERNLLLVDNLKSKKGTRTQDVIRMYENILQCLSEMEQLPSVSDDKSFLENVACQTCAFKAFRCYFIGEILGSDNKWVEATALYNRCLGYVKDALSRQKYLDKVLVSQLKELSQLVDGKTFSAKANSILVKDELANQVSKLKLTTTNDLLVNRLDEYCDDLELLGKQPRIVDFPPQFQAVACKPLFFDLALNHVQLPSLADLIEQKKASGITGMVKGWLWGSSGAPASK